MLCIPTHVRTTSDDPELARALTALLAQLRARGLTKGSDVAQPHRGAQWRYVFSTPVGNDDGSIAYLHVFYHTCHPATSEPLALGVPAAPTWWPDARCEILSPRRSASRACLRLAS
jgi:hypothetical protein